MNHSPDKSNTIGQRIHDLVFGLYPIHRSQTGEGVRESLQILRSLIPLEIHEVPSGMRVFDWEIPQEWNISDAWIADDSGNRIVDFCNSNLHVVNGSDPVHTTLSWGDLKKHLITLPEQPDLVPYRTSFFGSGWGFCISHNQFNELERLGESQYEVCIDTSRTTGSLTYGELLIPGESDSEVLLSTHTCHPSLANDGISGMAIAAFLGQWLRRQKHRYSYRLLFAPATIGTITWLALNKQQVNKIRHGLVLSCLGDSGHLNYRRSRSSTAEIDRTVVDVLSETCDDFAVHEFEPFGYDQRQFCSPGFDLPVGCLMRTLNGEFPEYHTSADDLNCVRASALHHSFTTLTRILDRLEQNYSDAFVNVMPECEPQLGKHGLYHAFGSKPDAQNMQRATMWLLNLSDGRHSLVDIAYRSKLSVSLLAEAAELLTHHGFLEATCSRTCGDSRFSRSASSSDSFSTQFGQVQA